MDRRVALVTGGSRGIGASCVRVLHGAGFAVALHYRRDQQLAEQIGAELDGCITFRADLAEDDAAESLIKRVKAQMGSVDVLVNNAGLVKDQLLPFARLEDFDKIMQVNLRSLVALSKFASKIMIRKRWGRIINISSVLGHTGNFGQSIYAASKGAITAFTKSIAQDLAQFNILCNCVAPGFIISEMTEGLNDEVKQQINDRIALRRFGQPVDVAKTVAFLASENASYITASTIHVNGGLFSN